MGEKPPSFLSFEMKTFTQEYLFICAEAVQFYLKKNKKAGLFWGKARRKRENVDNSVVNDVGGCFDPAHGFLPALARQISISRFRHERLNVVDASVVNQLAYM